MVGGAGDALRQRERGEDPHGVQRDQPVHASVEGNDERDGAGRQQNDAVREDEFVAQIDELARQEPVSAEYGGEPWEIGEAGVGGEHEDEHGGELHGVVERHAPRWACLSPDCGGYLVDDGWRRVPPVVAVDDPQPHSQQRDADEQRGQDTGHPEQRDGRIAGFGRAKGRDAVAYRLCARHGRAPTCERHQYQP